MEYAVSGPQVLFMASLWFLGWWLSCSGIGSLVVPLDIRHKDLAGEWLYHIFSVSLGMFLLSIGTFVCASIGRLNLPAILPFFALGLLLWIRNVRRCGFREWTALREFWQEAEKIDKIILFSVSTLVIVSFIASQAPLIANDSLAYHMCFPKSYVKEGGLVNDLSHPRSFWPSMMGMLFSVGLLCQGTALATLFSWLTAVLTVLAIPVTLYYFSHNKDIARAGAVFIGFIPALWMQSLYPYTDSAMMLFTFLSFIALWLWKERGFAYQDSIMAGLCLAALLSIKLFNLISFLILAILFGMSSVFSPTRLAKKLKSMSILMLTCVLFSAFWFVRSWMMTGNPVFPFMGRLFGGMGFSQKMVGYAEIPKTLVNFILLPWNLAFKVDRFGGEPVGCLFLAALPIAFSCLRLRGIFRLSMLFVMAYVTVWFFSIQMTRFLLPVFPFLSFVFAYLVADWLQKSVGMKKWILRGFFSIVILQFFLSLYYPARMLEGALGLVSSDDYLRRHERTYGFMKKINPLLSPNDKILFVAEPRRFYSPVSAIYLDASVNYLCRKSGVTFAEWLNKNDVTHLLVRNQKESESLKFPSLGENRILNRPASLMASQKVEVEDMTSYYALWKLE